MGKTKPNPRYNVLSLRASDAELAEIAAHIGEGDRAPFLLEAALEKVRRDRQRRLDRALP